MTVRCTSADVLQALSNDEMQAFRGRSQLGGINALLRTQNTLQIVSHSQQTRRVAVQMSRNFCQYFGADTEILYDTRSPTKHYSNVVRVVVSRDLTPGHLEHFALQVDSSGDLNIRTAFGQKVFRHAISLGAIFLRPLSRETVELVVWGADADGLETAARLVPMLTGVGQADFIVADKQMLWRGAGGVLAMGFFDHFWNVTESSYFA